MSYHLHRWCIGLESDFHCSFKSMYLLDPFLNIGEAFRSHAPVCTSKFDGFRYYISHFTTLYEPNWDNLHPVGNPSIRKREIWLISSLSWRQGGRERTNFGLQRISFSRDNMLQRNNCKSCGKSWVSGFMWGCSMSSLSLNYCDKPTRTSHHCTRPRSNFAGW